MKLPSLQHLFDQIVIVSRRFLIPVLFAIVGTIAAVSLIKPDYEQHTVLIRLLFSCILGLPFSIGCMLYAERRGRGARLPAVIAAIVLPALYGFFLAPDILGEDDTALLLFFVLLVVAHLFVSVAAYLRVQEYEGFWRFNELLFLRMVISGIFSAVLFAGLALAIASVDNLFQANIDEDTYPKLWCVVVGIFNTWFFLAGVPANYAAVNTRRDFPRWLKLFSQYILLPLATLYLVILYAYGIKILIDWSLPRGWVSGLIMWYAVIGLLAILLVYPLREQKEHTWIRMFTRIFFVALLPLIALLYAAIFARTRQYGITEPRYYLIVLGLWLTFIALYFILSPKKNIKLIPISLMIAGLLTVFGPWSSFRVSTRSQVAQMKEVLGKYGIQRTGTGMTPPKDSLAKDDAMQLYSIVQYFIEKREVKALNSIYAQDVARIAAGIEQKNKEAAGKRKEMYYRYTSTEQTRDTLLAMLHVNMSMTDVVHTRRPYSTYQSPDKGMVDISGYDKLYEYRYNRYEDEMTDRTTNATATDTIALIMKNDRTPALLMTSKSDTLARFELGPVIDSFKKNSSATFRVAATGRVNASMVVSWFELRPDSSKSPIEHWQAYILLKK